MGYKIRVYVNHKPVGFVRWLLNQEHGLRESLLATHISKATKFDNSPAGLKDIALAMTDMKAPERETVKGLDPKLTFQLINV